MCDAETGGLTNHTAICFVCIECISIAKLHFQASGFCFVSSFDGCGTAMHVLKHLGALIACLLNQHTAFAFCMLACPEYSFNMNIQSSYFCFSFYTMRVCWQKLTLGHFQQLCHQQVKGPSQIMWRQSMKHMATFLSSCLTWPESVSIVLGLFNAVHAVQCSTLSLLRRIVLTHVTLQHQRIRSVFLLVQPMPVIALPCCPKNNRKWSFQVCILSNWTVEYDNGHSGLFWFIILLLKIIPNKCNVNSNSLFYNLKQHNCVFSWARLQCSTS